jgi:hypothetical protein
MRFANRFISLTVVVFLSLSFPSSAKASTVMTGNTLPQAVYAA